jgi:glyoxalase superfamily protein
MACRIREIVIDAADPDRLASFWSNVLGYAELERPDHRPGRAQILPTSRRGRPEECRIAAGLFVAGVTGTLRT